MTVTLFYHGVKIFFKIFYNTHKTRFQKSLSVRQRLVCCIAEARVLYGGQRPDRTAWRRFVSVWRKLMAAGDSLPPRHHLSAFSTLESTSSTNILNASATPPFLNKDTSSLSLFTLLRHIEAESTPWSRVPRSFPCEIQLLNILAPSQWRGRLCFLERE